MCHVDADSILFVCVLIYIINNIHFKRCRLFFLFFPDSLKIRFSSAGDTGFSEKPATPRATAAGFSENHVPPAVRMKLRLGEAKVIFNNNIILSDHK